MMAYDFINTYWGGNGAEQGKYDEMEAAGFKYTKATEAVFYRYKRFFNDGDCPSYLRRIMHLSQSALEREPEYIAHCEKLESQVTERILVEYRKFMAARKVVA